jgi:peptidoglycan hydrolase-like protein with peptidoglycan-binding domain
MADLTLPRGKIYTVEQEDQGAAVYGIQRSLNRSGLFDSNIKLDGVYGEQTAKRVKVFQKKLSIDQDGRFGPDTSKTASVYLQQTALHESGSSLPVGLTFSIVSLESGDLIAANNWSVAGGVDLSYVQRRVYTPYDDNAVKRAFDAVYQFKLLINTLRGRFDKYWSQPNAVKTQEKAWRLAALSHNYPSGADKIAEVGEEGLSSYWTTSQKWVTDHSTTSGKPQSEWRKFADGVPVTTPLEWCQHYALGAPAHNHEGIAVRGVSSWAS